MLQKIKCIIWYIEVKPIVCSTNVYNKHTLSLVYCRKCTQTRQCTRIFHSSYIKNVMTGFAEMGLSLYLPELGPDLISVRAELTTTQNKHVLRTWREGRPQSNFLLLDLSWIIQCKNANGTAESALTKKAHP